LVGSAMGAVAVGAAGLSFARANMGPPGAMWIAAAAASTSRPVDRTITLTTTDALRFGPAVLTVRKGETIRFQINNPGAVPHELFVGDATEQQVHEREMATPGMGAEANGIAVPAGQTVQLVYTFDRGGTLEFGCHVAGHYAAGMRGTINITPS